MMRNASIRSQPRSMWSPRGATYTGHLILSGPSRNSRLIFPRAAISTPASATYNGLSEGSN